MISFSAKDLCTRSCMQIRFFNENPDKRPKPNVNTIFGESFQHKVAEKKNEKKYNTGVWRYTWP